MSIGLYDADMAAYKTTPINLELCKYSTYYKKKREIVALSPSFIPNNFSTYIMRKDYQDGKFPPNFKQYNNLIYGGHAFSGQQYIALDEDIERRVPDVSIYEKCRLIFGSTNKLIAAFDVMMRASHLRLSLDGKEVWSDFHKQLNFDTSTRTLFFHDYDINQINGARDAVEDLMKMITNGCTTGFLATKFPLKIDNFEDLVYWCGYKSTGSFFNLEYYGPMEDEELYSFLKMQDLKANPSKIDYIVTAKYSDQNDFLEQGLLKIFNQVLFLRRNHTKILLKYEDDFFVDKRWERVIDLFNCFMSSTLALNLDWYKRVIDFDNLYSFVKSFDDVVRFDKLRRFNKQEARDLFLLVKETNYDVFKSFYEGHKVELIGGKFVNDATGRD